MRARGLRLVPLAVVLLVAGCSDDDTAGDAVLSASPATSTTESIVTTTTAPAAGHGSSTTQRAVDQAALRDAIAEVQGLGALEPAQLDCLSSRLAGDDGVLTAVGRGLTFEALEPPLQERVLLMTVGCAPAVVASSVVDGIGAELDGEARACVVDRMAADEDFLVTLVQVVLATRDPDPAATAMPPAVVDGLVALAAACDVPLTALPE